MLFGIFSREPDSSISVYDNAGVCGPGAGAVERNRSSKHPGRFAWGSTTKEKRFVMRQASIWPRVALMLVAVAMVMAGIVGTLATTSAYAQDDTEEYTSPVSGAVIEATSPWELDPDASASGDGYDIIGLASASDS